jgi:uncharacterized protein (TIGR02680 family)
MTATSALHLLPHQKPTLPAPTRPRWQPLRLGVVELFHYDSEEFWFRDGHLLLRGNNGTGKSKVLSLTLPFLLDAQIKSSRIEPDGDSSKRMTWNLLMNSHDRRNGYAWIEFGYLNEGSIPRYLTLGVGLSAVAARPQVDSWFFLVEDAEQPLRINQDFWLMNEQRIVLTKERLREALQGRGQVFDTATSYRRAVDERLFHLGAKRYDALMDTLIQLRQPQLSRRPDETALSNALTEALPPLAPELLGDVAEALGQLEEDRRQLEEYQALAKAVAQFDQRYRVYAGTQSRRQARTLRQAQTEFDNASRARSEAHARLENARNEEAKAQTTYHEVEVTLAGERTRLETLRTSPAMEDANRLEMAVQEVAARRRAAEETASSLKESNRRAARIAKETELAKQRVLQAEHRMTGLRQISLADAEAAGIASLHANNPLSTLKTGALGELTQGAFDGAAAALQELVTGRREQIALLRQRHADMAPIEARYTRCLETRNDRRDTLETAVNQRALADAEVERKGRDLIDAWERHFAALKQLQVGADNSLAALTALSGWVAALDGDNPARARLQAAQRQANLRLAQRRVALDGERQALEAERKTLEDERDRLDAGVDLTPPAPYTRISDARAARAGAPLWHLIDFHDAVTTMQRAGLEAALEAAGLLDAWVSPDGRLQTGEHGALLHDTQVLERRPQSTSLADWLKVALPDHTAVSADIVERVLATIACSDHDLVDSEAWVAPDGRFRLGNLAGAWGKAAALHIGYAARTAARERRQAEIAERLVSIGHELAVLQAASEQLAVDQDEADAEWRLAPSDDILREAHLVGATVARAAQLARDRLVEADAQYREAEEALRSARERLAADAADLRLPKLPAALPSVEAALNNYQDAQIRLTQTIHELRLALADLERQRVYQNELRDDVKRYQEQLETARIEAEEASSRFEVLREAVGTKVEELQCRLADARAAVERSESELDRANAMVRAAGERRAVADEQASAANATFEQSSEARAQAISRFRQFALAGLLSAALPQLDMPDAGSSWTIDPALTLARRVEQALSHVKDDDDAWKRVQRQIGEDFTELQRSLSALGHQALAEQSDWGLIVSVVYQNRSERPDRLAARLAAEIDQRVELLNANERAVLENHLQAEIASEVQRLLQAAEAQRDSINKELHKRPTSTGVRFRLLWQPLSEDEGAPVGLEAARKRLLNTNADLWSSEDRRVVGAMLQQRIAAERELAESDGGSLIDQLSRALDYRRWHRFRVERWQDGQWRRLSGPASSGERALGLTVPLFAAVASFYSQGSYALAPRLILLDEAFAGIDDTARAHCMGLIREFDLDFLITSEREWACYAELPGVSICQLQRREGIDAVFVSRWTWDGKARVRQPDPDRRFSST